MVMTSLNKEANEAFLRGDAISDDELRSLLTFYERSVHMMEQLGIQFRNTTNTLLSRLRTLQSYQDARRER